MSNTNTNTSKRPYLGAVVGRTVENAPYAFHLEGYAASTDPRFFPADGEKQARFTFSIGIHGPADALLARAEGTYDKGKTYTMSEFVDLSFFGKDAEAVSAIYEKGMKLAVAGKLSLRTYNKSDGTPGSSVTCAVSRYALMETRGKSVKAAVTDNFGTVSYVYKDKTGSDRVIPMAELLTGTVVGTPKLGESNGKKYFGFGLKTASPAAKVYDAANQVDTKDKEYDAGKRIVNAVVFDVKAETLSKLVRTGTMLVVTGPIREEEYNGAMNYRMSAREVGIMKYAPVPAGEGDEGSNPTGPAPAGSVAAAAEEAAFVPSSEFVDMDDEDGELPF